MRYELIPEWKHAWKWYSTNALAISAAIPPAWASLPETWQNHAHWILYVLTPAVAISGIIGRILQKKDPGCSTDTSDTDSATATAPGAVDAA